MQAGVSLFLIDRLRHYNHRRNSFIKFLSEKSEYQQAHESGQQAAVKISTLAPLFRILQSPIGFHCIVFFSTLTVIISIFSSTRSLTLFSLHPICMTLGSLLCISQGIVAYRNDSLLETLSPIMQHSKRTKVRSIHQTLQLMGVIFLILGILFILSHKIELRHSILPSSIHSIIGALVILTSLVQVVVGHDKLENLESNRKKVATRKWHGDLGLLLWDILCIAVLSGLWAVLKISLTHLLVESAVLVVWLAVHIQMMYHASGAAGSVVQSSSNKRNSTASSDSFEEDDEVYEDDADGVALLDMDNSASVTHLPPNGDSDLSNSNSGQQTGIAEHTKQSIQHNNADNYAHKSSSGRKKYSDFYGFADDDDDDSTFV